MDRKEVIKRLKEARSTIQPFRYVDEAIDYVVKTWDQDQCDACVNREAVHRQIINWVKSDDYGKSLLDLHKRIDTLPIITSKPKEGRWIKEKSLHGWDGKSYQCSVCGRSIHIDPEVEDLSDYPYCHCGAIMTEEEEKK